MCVLSLYKNADTKAGWFASVVKALARLSPCVLVQPDGWARGEREGYGGPRDVTSLSLSLSL